MISKCPLCGGRVVYQGLSGLECEGDDACQNLGKDVLDSRSVAKSMRDSLADWEQRMFDAWGMSVP